MTASEREAFTKILCAVFSETVLTDTSKPVHERMKQLENQINIHLKDHMLNYRFTYGGILEQARFINKGKDDEEM